MSGTTPKISQGQDLRTLKGKDLKLRLDRLVKNQETMQEYLHHIAMFQAAANIGNAIRARFGLPSNEEI